MLKRLILTLFLGVAGIALSFAQDSTSIWIEQLILKSDDQQTAAIENLVKAEEASTFPVLGAVIDKKLYLFQNTPVTLGEKVTNDKGDEAYELIQLYPEVKSLEGDPQPLDNLQEVNVSRKDRLLILPLSGYINLTNADPEKRKLAYTQFQNKEDQTLIKKLRKALAKEPDPEVVRIGLEAVYSIKLNDKDDKVKLSAIDSLKENLGLNTQYILETYLEKEGLSKEVKAATTAAIEELDSRAGTLSFIQNLFSGLSLGSILILIALGLSIIYGLAGVINMAHGEFLMIGAYTTFCLQEIFLSIAPESGGLFFWFALPISFLVAGLFGYLVEWLVIRHLYHKPLESLLATWGISLVFIQLARTVFGDLTAVKTPEALSGGWEVVPQLVLPYNRIFVIVLTIALISLTYLMLFRTRLGLRIRSVTQNRNMSSCIGINTRKIDSATFFIGSGIAGVAGCAMTLIGNVVPDMGQTYIVDSFLVVVTGGVGKLSGAIISGLGIGFLTKFLEPVFEAVYGKVLILVIIILFLQFKPKGLFPDKGRIGDD